MEVLEKVASYNKLVMSDNKLVVSDSKLDVRKQAGGVG